jgi:hypothetical protein
MAAVGVGLRKEPNRTFLVLSGFPPSRLVQTVLGAVGYLLAALPQSGLMNEVKSFIRDAHEFR